MEKPTSLSVHRAQKIFHAWPILLVFFLALLTRLYWIHEKEYMYIDDPTSVSLAYNLPGWGKKTFEVGHILTGKELRQQCYIDDRGGLEGLWDDLAALHHDNRDGSHASLYYMALRCALTGVDTPSTDVLIRRSCGLNLVFFGLSFLSMALLLRMLFPGKTMLTTFCLLLAYMNPVSVSNVLQAREYLMAEWLFVLWAYWCLRAAARIHNQQTLWAPGTFTGGLAISAALLSCGYFNALFFGFTLLCLAVYSCRQHAYKDLGFYPVLGIASLLLCVLLYEGFFNFLHDARATEVADKMQGGDWLSNLRLTVIGLGYITALRILTPVWGTAIILYLVTLLVRKPKQPFHSHRLPGAWLFVCTMAWAVVVMWMANWKATRYISPSVPLCLVAVAYYLALGLQRVPKVLAGIFVAAFIAYAWCERPMEYVNRTSDREWPSHAKRILLYGPDHEEKNTLLLITHFIGDKQEIAIVEHTTDIRHYVAEEDTTVYVYGAKNSPDLQTEPGYKMEKEFNDWMSVYTFNFQ